MKIVFHEKYYNSNYSIDAAAEVGRLEPIMAVLSSKKSEYEIIAPKPATEKDILRAHTEGHLNQIKSDPFLYEMASLSAGGAILAAEEAFEGNAAFAVIRPPGHHASADSYWGFCFFNNISVSLLKLHAEKKIKSAFILDFDLHVGDGTINIMSSSPLKVKILNPTSNTRTNYLKEVEEYMHNLKNIDIFAASAGFDEYELDWGHKLATEDFRELGRLMKEYSLKLCKGRRFAVLEGGYYFQDLGKNADAFCQGFK